MKVLVKDVASFYKYNPDEMASFAMKFANKYGATEGDIETITIDRSKVDEFIVDWGLSNRLGHNWREVSETFIYEEDMGNIPISDPDIAQKLASGQIALNKEDLKIEQLKNKMVIINKRKSRIQKAMIKAQEEGAMKMKQQAKDDAQAQKIAKDTTDQAATAQQPAPLVALPQIPTTESLLQSEFNELELLEDKIITLYNQNKDIPIKMIEKIIEGETVESVKNYNLISKYGISKDKFYDVSEAFEESEEEKKTKEEIAENYMHFIKVYNDEEWFIGKIFKETSDGDWFGEVKAGESDNFDNISYEPDYDIIDIIQFLRDTYDKVEVIDELEYNDYVENNPPEELDEEGGVSGMHL